MKILKLSNAPLAYHMGRCDFLRGYGMREVNAFYQPDYNEGYRDAQNEEERDRRHRARQVVNQRQREKWVW